MVIGGNTQTERDPDAPERFQNRTGESEQVLSLRQGLHQFIVTMKNMALYPDTSQTNRQASFQLLEWMSGYMKAHGPMVLHVNKDMLFTQRGENVYQEKSNDQLLAFPLFRDGIQTLIFEPGLTEDELRKFINIMLRFKTATENDQDDVVTSMWEAAFNSIKYAIADEYEEVSPEFDTGAMVCSRPPANRPDIDAPYQALAPMETEGVAPVAKSIGALFALADTLDFSFAPGGVDGRVEDPHAEGKFEAENQMADGFPPPGGPAGRGGPGGDRGRGPGGGPPGNFPPNPSGDPDGDRADNEDEDGFAPFQSSTGINREDRFQGGVYYDDVPGRVRKARSERSLDDFAEDDYPLANGTGSGSGSGSRAVSDPGGALPGTPAPEGEEGFESGSYFDDTGGGNSDSPFGDMLQNMDLSQISSDSADEPNPELQAMITLPDEDERAEPDERTVANRAERLKFWGLSAREIKQVSALIQWDETRAKSYSILSMVLILLKSPVVKNAMRPAIVTFITEEIREALRKRFLGHANEFLAELQELSETKKRPAIVAIYEDVKKRMASPEFLSPLPDVSADEDSVNAMYDDLRYFLYQLPPNSIFVLIAMLAELKSLKLKKLFIEVVAWHIPKVEENLGKIAPLLNEWAIRELISMLTAMRLELPTQLASNFSRHANPAIRELAARYILDNDQDNIQAIAHLIVDREPKIRELVTPRLTRRRDPTVEAILYHHISANYLAGKDRPDILEYYRAFGMSAGFGSAAFLTEVLTKKDLGALFGGSKSNHRTGAALALLLMPATTGAEEILRKAKKSSFRSFRNAINAAKKILDAEGRR
ncbi:MAG: hypothetical protein LBF41_09610 [Deltaproteobacteria bacterium]|jgi:hypothetical protein|nr:hypothetical protein [Deltaproteobacteria bacterium]